MGFGNAGTIQCCPKIATPVMKQLGALLFFSLISHIRTGIFKSDNLYYNMLVLWVAGTKEKDFFLQYFSPSLSSSMVSGGWVNPFISATLIGLLVVNEGMLEFSLGSHLGWYLSSI